MYCIVHKVNWNNIFLLSIANFSVVQSPLFLLHASFYVFNASSKCFLWVACSLPKHIMDHCNSHGRRWNVPQFLSQGQVLPLLPVTKDWWYLPKSLFVPVCPSAITLSRQIVPAIFRPTIEVACTLSDMLVDVFIPRVAFQHSSDNIARLLMPPTLESQSEVTFLGSI